MCPPLNLAFSIILPPPIEQNPERNAYMYVCVNRMYYVRVLKIHVHVWVKVPGAQLVNMYMYNIFICVLMFMCVLTLVSFFCFPD